MIDQFIGGLDFENDLLTGVAYEPMDYSHQWHDIEGHIAEVRRVRALAATATQHGTFRPQGTIAQELATYLQQLKGLDPALAVYAAYAYHDLGMADRIREMYDYQCSGLGVGLFDVALLARAILDGDVHDRLLPPLPMLSRGWSLLEVFGASLPDAVARLGDHLTPSLWTLFDADAAPLVARAMQNGDLG